MHRLPLVVPVSRNGLSRLRIGVSDACQQILPQRRHATGLSAANVNHEATDIAILGGGITGLASAHFLSKSLPNAKITLFEASSRLGGWLHSRQVDVDNGKVVFEQGPRNLRPKVPNGLITLDLVCLRSRKSAYFG